MHKDILPGGKADNKDPKDFDPKAVSKGEKVEREHVKNKEVQREIARDHLTEDPKYYDKLEKIEKKAFWIGFEKQAGFRIQSAEQLKKMRDLLKPEKKSVDFLKAQKDRVAKYLERSNLTGHSKDTVLNTAAGKDLKK